MAPVWDVQFYEIKRSLDNLLEMYKDEAKRLGQGKLFRMLKHVAPRILDRDEKLKKMVLKEANLSENDPHYNKIWDVFRRELVKNIRTKRNSCVQQIREKYISKEKQKIRKKGDFFFFFFFLLIWKYGF